MHRFDVDIVLQRRRRLLAEQGHGLLARAPIQSQRQEVLFFYIPAAQPSFVIGVHQSCGHSGSLETVQEGLWAEGETSVYWGAQGKVSCTAMYQRAQRSLC